MLKEIPVSQIKKKKKVAQWRKVGASYPIGWCNSIWINSHQFLGINQSTGNKVNKLGTYGQIETVKSTIMRPAMLAKKIERWNSQVWVIQSNTYIDNMLTI